MHIEIMQSNVNKLKKRAESKSHYVSKLQKSISRKWQIPSKHHFEIDFGDSEVTQKWILRVRDSISPPRWMSSLYVDKNIFKQFSKFCQIGSQVLYKAVF